MNFILILLFLMVSCGKSSEGVNIEKKTPIDLLKDNLASLEYEYSALISVAGASLNNCNEKISYGKIIQSMCSFKNESNAGLKFQLVSQMVSFVSFLYPDLQTLRQDVEALADNNSLTEVEQNNKKLYLENKIFDFYTKFNFISNTVTDTSSAIVALENATINANNTQNLIALLQNQITTMQNEIASIENELALIDDRESDLQAELSDLNDELTTLISSVGVSAADIVNLQNEINLIEDEIADLGAQDSDFQTEITNLNNNLTTLTNTVDTATTDIGTLQTDANSILKPELIGAQNLGAGPVYELILRRADKRQVIGYTRQNTSVIRLPSNPFATVNASATVTVTTSAVHNLAVGEVVSFAGLAAGANFTTGQLTGEYAVQSIVSTTKFTVTMSTVANATSAGIGGASGRFQKVFVNGMTVAWNAGQVSDAVVRQTSIGTKTYNYIIRRISTDTSNNTAEICYDKTNNIATFAVINAAPAGGSGNVVCL